MAKVREETRRWRPARGCSRRFGRSPSRPGPKALLRRGGDEVAGAADEGGEIAGVNDVGRRDEALLGGGHGDANAGVEELLVRPGDAGALELQTTVGAWIGLSRPDGARGREQTGSPLATLAVAFSGDANDTLGRAGRRVQKLR